jgi:hypothetical protein
MSNSIIEKEEPWTEWKDGDDSDLFDKGHYEGYYEALEEVLEIVKNLKNKNEVNLLPSSYTLSVVGATLIQMIEERDNA